MEGRARAFAFLVAAGDTRPRPRWIPLCVAPMDAAKSQRAGNLRIMLTPRCTCGATDQVIYVGKATKLMINVTTQTILRYRYCDTAVSILRYCGIDTAVLSHHIRMQILKY